MEQLINILDYKQGKIQSFSGAIIDFKNPHLSDFRLVDIAKGHANDCRFGGQLKKFYSVAQHTMLVKALAPPHLALCAMFHDAPEAYMRDIPKPLKHLLPEYNCIEERMAIAIFNKFNISHDLMIEVKEFDLKALEIENDAFRCDNTEAFTTIMQHIGYLPIVWTPEQAEIIWFKNAQQLLREALYVH